MTIVYFCRHQRPQRSTAHRLTDGRPLFKVRHPTFRPANADCPPATHAVALIAGGIVLWINPALKFLFNEPQQRDPKSGQKNGDANSHIIIYVVSKCNTEVWPISIFGQERIAKLGLISEAYPLVNKQYLTVI